jgi:hypothetical protein
MANVEELNWARARDMLDFRIASITGGIRLNEMGDTPAISEAVQEIVDVINDNENLVEVMKQFDLTWFENSAE